MPLLAIRSHALLHVTLYGEHAHLRVTKVAVDALQDDSAIAQRDANALKAQRDARADDAEGLEGQAAAAAAARRACDAQQRRDEPPQLVLRALLLPEPILIQPVNIVPYFSPPCSPYRLW